MGNSSFSWGFFTCSCAPWMYSAVPSSLLEVRTPRMVTFSIQVGSSQVFSNFNKTISPSPPSWIKELKHLSGSGFNPGLELMSESFPLYPTPSRKLFDSLNLQDPCCLKASLESLKRVIPQAKASRKDQSRPLLGRALLGRAHRRYFPWSEHRAQWPMSQKPRMKCPCVLS